MKEYRNHNGNMRFSAILTAIFITLKLTGHITWSWWWVFFPLWIEIAIGLTIITSAFLIWKITNKDREND